MNVKSLVAEFIGTFTLLFLGIGAAAAGGTLIDVALAHGLAIAVMGSAFGMISGGHFNPAVTLALVVAGKCPSSDLLPYWVAQILGAITSVFTLSFVMGKDVVAAASYGIPALGKDIGMAQGIVAEIVLTFFLMAVIFGTAVHGKAPKLGALFIGLVIVADIFTGASLTGAAMNPARYLGPAVSKGDFAQIGVYLVGPVLGALLATLVYKTCFDDEDR